MLNFYPEQKPITILEPEDLRIIFKNLNPDRISDVRNHTILKLMVFNGLKANQITKLNQSDFSENHFLCEGRKYKLLPEVRDSIQLWTREKQGFYHPFFTHVLKSQIYPDRITRPAIYTALENIINPHFPGVQLTYLRFSGWIFHLREGRRFPEILEYINITSKDQADLNKLADSVLRQKK